VYHVLLIDKGFYSELCTNKDGGNFYNHSFYGTSSIEDVKLTTVIPFISNIDHVTSHHFINRRGLDSKTNLTPQLFIEMPGPNQENERSCICVVGVYKFGIIGPKILSM
jgi:hypothetical protein